MSPPPASILVLLRLATSSSSSSSISPPLLPVRTFLGMMRFYFAIVFVEALYRLHLNLFGVRPPVCFDEPWKSETVAEFWGKRWNLAIAGQLRNVFFKPLAEMGHRAAGEVAVFLGSALLHMIPIVSMGGSRG